ncbi:tetraacyldisaccharide 4'-kinase [Vibrio mangrovi]|uniref:Tetraacyldisaccharide 4'-kinase n=1 Tax=Vibrio mangrovi TaxID=474394 RepID=A0A1Y6IPF9_9VIBR|nr:tetraacyldisaccharide 4'-kinase [Vibrio mangrovi]MDW6003690.1 tetraacyldisaccharide 4'-kinase [Vibrio mangrovi]SMR99518.1 Tetraacyldisaccharide 4'-kinase [Vibrio mangrovi]
MIEKIWFTNHLIGKFLAPVLWPLSRLYRVVSESRKKAYQQGRKATYRAPVPVIVVGNITAGGNGKTPIVVWLVEALQQMGMTPGVISRGYGGKAPQYPLLLKQDTPVEHCGDEPKLIYQRTGAPVAVAPRRADAVKALLSQGVNVVVADDGLQHYALERDVEIVVVDGQRRFGNQQFIPYGPLRESLHRLETVDFVITNGGEPGSDEIPMTLAPQQAVNLCSGIRKDVKQLNRLSAVAGIGNPSRFFQTLSQLGASLVATREFADHYQYSSSDIEGLSQEAEHIIMTEKDAVKCRSFAKENWWYLPVSATFRPMDEQKILRSIEEVIEQYGSSSA